MDAVPIPVFSWGNFPQGSSPHVGGVVYVEKGCVWSRATAARWSQRATSARRGHFGRSRLVPEGLWIPGREPVWMVHGVAPARVLD